MNLQKETELQWIIEPNAIEAIKSQTIKGNTTKSVGFSVVYPDGDTGYLIIGKVGSKSWQPAQEIKSIQITWK